MKKKLLYLAIATVVVATTLSFTVRKQTRVSTEDTLKTSGAPIGGTTMVE